MRIKIMNEGRNFRVGLIKAVPKKWNIEKNWKIFEKLALLATERGAQIICTPECFLDGYVAPKAMNRSMEQFNRIAQTLDGDNYLSKARDFANTHSVHLVFGFTERAEKGCYNAAALISDKGEILGCYHKTHLLDHDRVYLPGKKLTVWETTLGKIGIMICADRRWPETARTLRVQGARLILNPTYGMWNELNERMMCTRSYENECTICFTHPTLSLVTAPTGEILANDSGDSPDLTVMDISLAGHPTAMFDARRPEIYGPLTSNG